MHINLPFRKTLIITRPKLMIVPKRDVRAMGWHSRCEDGMHIVFLDYDWIDEEILFQDLGWLQRRFKLSDFYVFTTKREKLDIFGMEDVVGSYHAVCFDKLPYFEVYDVLKYSHTDAAFKIGAYLNTAKAWTLRTHEDYRPKPQFFRVTESPFSIREQSSAHAAFVKKHYFVNVKLKRPDRLSLVWLEAYNTKMKEEK